MKQQKTLKENNKSIEDGNLSHRETHVNEAGNTTPEIVAIALLFNNRVLPGTSSEHHKRSCKDTKAKTQNQSTEQPVSRRNVSEKAREETWTRFSKSFSRRAAASGKSGVRDGCDLFVAQINGTTARIGTCASANQGSCRSCRTGEGPHAANPSVRQSSSIIECGS